MIQGQASRSYADLKRRYPLIFAEPLVDQGIACGIGWFDLVDELCGEIQQHIDLTGDPQVVAVQVKEKLGELRFVCSATDQTVRELISDACARSRTICDACGAPGTLKHEPGRLQFTRCDMHINGK